MSMIANLLRVTKADLDAYLNDSSLLEEAVYNNETENPSLVDLDKSWDGILFLLTGQNVANTEHPLAKVLFSGQLIDEEQDLGYGPAHYLTPEQVVELNVQIANISVADLKPKYDPKKMTEMEVYPTIWDEGDEAFEYLAEYFKDLQKVFAEAAKNGEAVITFVQ